VQNEHVAEGRLSCLPAWRRGHCVQEGRRHQSIRSVPGLNQGPQSRQHRGAAGAQREVEREGALSGRQRTIGTWNGCGMGVGAGAGRGGGSEFL
jgi:hypothetical protein